MCTWHAAACSCRQGHETQHAQWGEGLPRKLPAAHRRASVGRSPPQAAMAGHTTADSEEEAWGKTEAAHLCNNERPAAGPSAANSQPHSCPSGHPTRARAHHPLGATFPDALPPLWRRAYRPLMCHIVRSSPPPERHDHLPRAARTPRPRPRTPLRNAHVHRRQAVLAHDGHHLQHHRPAATRQAAVAHPRRALEAGGIVVPRLAGSAQVGDGAVRQLPAVDAPAVRVDRALV